MEINKAALPCWRQPVRSEAFFGLAEFAFFLRGGGGLRFLAAGDVVLRNLKAAEEKHVVDNHRIGSADRQKS